MHWTNYWRNTRHAGVSLPVYVARVETLLQYSPVECPDCGDNMFWADYERGLMRCSECQDMPHMWESPFEPFA